MLYVDINPKALNQKTLAGIFGVDPKSVRNWSADGCPRNEDGSYPAPAVIDWYATRRAEAAQAELEQFRAAAADAGGHNERWQKARADKLEIEVAERLGEFARTEDVEHQWVLALTTISTTLQSLPESIAVRIAGRGEDEVRDILEHALRGALEQMQGAYASALDEELD